MKIKHIFLGGLVFIILMNIPSGQAQITYDMEKHVVEYFTKDFSGRVINTVYDANGDAHYYDHGYADGNGNYYISSYEIPGNYSLIIKPGVSIYFTGQWGIIVYGSILAIGTEPEPIVFTANDTGPGQEIWGGIEIKDDYPGSAEFKYCRIEYCFGFRISRNVSFEHCDFIQTAGIDCGKGNREIDRLIFNNCTMTGTRFWEGIGLFLSGTDYIEVNDNYFNDPNVTIGVASNDIISFNRNTVIGGYWMASVSGHGNGRYSVKDNYIEDQMFSLNGNLVVEDNEVHGYVKFNLKDQPVSIRNNIFNAYIAYDNVDNQTKPLDLRYNYWGVDWYVEDNLGFENECIDGTWEDYIDVIYEPYFDSNWTETDNDGTPNGWEHTYGFDIYVDDSGLDPDNDNLTNLLEWQHSGNYTSGGLNPLDFDTDYDGLSDDFEINKGFDPLSKDSDNDGMPDAWEYMYHLDPMDPNDAWADFESDLVEHPNKYPCLNIDVNDIDGDPGDGTNEYNGYRNFTNLEEFLNGTDPTNCDTDGDGMEDGWEVRHKLDPLFDDSDEDLDGDGWSNIEEYRAKTDPSWDASHPPTEHGYRDTFEMLGIIAIVVIILAVIGIILWFYIRKNRKKKKNKKKQDKPIEVKPVDEKDRDKKNAKSHKGRVSIECPGCSHSFKINSGQSDIKCPKCGLEGEL